MIKAPLYEHKATGMRYMRLAYGYDKTHGTAAVIYCPDDSEDTIYVRDIEEWEGEFEQVRQNVQASYPRNIT